MQGCAGELQAASGIHLQIVSLIRTGKRPLRLCFADASHDARVDLNGFACSFDAQMQEAEWAAANSSHLTQHANKWQAFLRKLGRMELAGLPLSLNNSLLHLAGCTRLRRDVTGALSFQSPRHGLTACLDTAARQGHSPSTMSATLAGARMHHALYLLSVGDLRPATPAPLTTPQWEACPPSARDPPPTPSSPARDSGYAAFWRQSSAGLWQPPMVCTPLVSTQSTPPMWVHAAANSSQPPYTPTRAAAQPLARNVHIPHLQHMWRGAASPWGDAEDGAPVAHRTPLASAAADAYASCQHLHCQWRATQTRHPFTPFLQGIYSAAADDSLSTHISDAVAPVPAGTPPHSKLRRCTSFSLEVSSPSHTLLWMYFTSPLQRIRSAARRGVMGASPTHPPPPRPQDSQTCANCGECTTSGILSTAVTSKWDSCGFNSKGWSGGVSLQPTVPMCGLPCQGGHHGRPCTPPVTITA